MKLVALISFFLSMLTHTASIAQQPVVFKGQPATNTVVDISSKTLFYDASARDTLSFAAIKKHRFIPLPQEYMQLKVVSKPLIVNWMKFKVQNTSYTDTLNMVFMCNSHVRTQLYTDEHLGQKPFFFEQTTTSAKGMEIVMLPKQTNTYYVQVIEHLHYLTPLKAVLITPVAYLKNYQQNSTNLSYLFLVMAMALGCLIFMVINACYQFILFKEQAIAYYIGYVGCAIYVWIIIIDQRFSLELFDPLKTNLYIPLSSGIVFFYALFIAYMLEIPKYHPIKWRIFQLLLGLIIVETIEEIISNYFRRFILADNYYFYIQPIPNILVNIYLIYLIIISKGVLKKYLLTGLLILFFLLIIVTNFSYYLFIEVDNPKLMMFANFPPIFGMLGVVGEAICFGFALAYRSKLMQEEKNKLQTDYATRLEVEVKQHTVEINRQHNLLEAQKLQKMEIAFEKKLAETEMTALRAQMNPHFIFNCLNSIKLYTLENNTEVASNYLTTFAKLIRRVLENSLVEKITLENELETLALYTELEIMRFKEKIHFSINISDDIDAFYIEVPPLLLQPYVENAIWHGLMHKDIGGSVSVNITQPEENLLHIEIIDDGVGRKKSAEYKSKSITKHKSFGLKMTTERLLIINQLYNIQTTISIIDLEDKYGKACGTKVSIDLPF